MVMTEGVGSGVKAGDTGEGDGVEGGGEVTVSVQDILGTALVNREQPIKGRSNVKVRINHRLFICPPPL